MTKRAWPAWADPKDILDLLRLSLPIAVSRASFMLMMLTDTIVLGRNRPEELPYVLNSHLPVGVLLGLSLGILLGVSVMTAEFSGKGEAHKTGRIFRRGVVSALLLGIVGVVPMFFGAHGLYSALGFEGAVLEGTTIVTRILAFAMLAQIFNTTMTYYLEALRKPLLVSVAMYIGVVVNLILDLAFVSGSWGFPELGATGVAFATTGTNWCLMFVLLGFVAWKTPAFKSSGEKQEGEAKRQISVGMGMAVSNVAEFGSFNFTHIIATWIGIAAASVYGMMFQTIGFVFMAFLGIGTATSVRVAERVGRGEFGAVKNASRLGLLVCVLVGAAAALLMSVANDGLASVFVQRDALVANVLLHPELSAMILFAAGIVIFDGLQNVAAMASRAQGLVWQPAIAHLASYMVIMVPLAWYLGLVQGRGVQGMAEAVLVASVFAAITQLIILEVLPRRALKKG